MKNRTRIFGLTGTNGAGKGEAAEYFRKNGYDYFSLSDLIREELVKKGLPPTRDNMIKEGNGLRKKYGPDILARRVMKKIKGNAVVDSIRNSREAAFLKKQKGFLLLGIDAPAALRFERVKQRGRDESAATFEEFSAKEKEEMASSQTGQQLAACMKMADLIILNDGTLDDFHKKLESFR
jgi:dephospho-CoA kinase